MGKDQHRREEVFVRDGLANNPRSRCRRPNTVAFGPEWIHRVSN
jgi:hypothetical protein